MFAQIGSSSIDDQERPSFEEIKKFILWLSKEHDLQGHENTVVYAYDKLNCLVGRFEIYRLFTEKPCAGVTIVPEQRRKGYATEMTKAVLQAAFEQWNIDFVDWFFFRGNEASLKIAKKLGGILLHKERGGELYRIHAKR